MIQENRLTCFELQHEFFLTPVCSNRLSSFSVLSHPKLQKWHISVSFFSLTNATHLCSLICKAKNKTEIWMMFARMKVIEPHLPYCNFFSISFLCFSDSISIFSFSLWNSLLISCKKSNEEQSYGWQIYFSDFFLVNLPFSPHVLGKSLFAFGLKIFTSFVNQLKPFMTNRN